MLDPREIPHGRKEAVKLGEQAARFGVLGAAIVVEGDGVVQMHHMVAEANKPQAKITVRVAKVGVGGEKSRVDEVQFRK